jgi:histidine kinase
VRRVDDVVEFLVTDSGIGIAAEHLPHVFEHFYRVDKSRSRAFGGSGIGLTIARALVEAMGGQIWARSDGLGRGATLGFTLPRAA